MGRISAGQGRAAFDPISVVEITNGFPKAVATSALDHQPNSGRFQPDGFRSGTVESCHIARVRTADYDNVP